MTSTHPENKKPVDRSVPRTGLVPDKPAGVDRILSNPDLSDWLRAGLYSHFVFYLDVLKMPTLLKNATILAIASSI